MPTVEKTIDVNVPVRHAFDAFSNFENFPSFMHNVTDVTAEPDGSQHWQAQVGSAHREWDAEVIEQIQDEVISWRSTDGTPNAGTVRFDELTPNTTRIRLALDYEAQAWTEKVADLLGVLDGVVEADLQRFKEFVESAETQPAELIATTSTVDNGVHDTPDQAVAHTVTGTGGTLREPALVDAAGIDDYAPAGQQMTGVDREPVFAGSTADPSP